MRDSATTCSHRRPKGNRQMRRVHDNAAIYAAVKAKKTIFAGSVLADIVPRLGHAQAIGAITHRLCRLIWKILHERVRSRGTRAGGQRRGEEGASAQDDLANCEVSATASNCSRLPQAARHDRERFSTLAHP